MKHMNRKLLLAGVALGLCSTFVLAQDAPESLLPPGFGNPAPAPAPAPAATPAQGSTRSPSSSSTSTPVIQPLPGTQAPAPVTASAKLPEGFPSLAELEGMTTDQIDEALGLKPKFDIPPAARRSLDGVGIIDSAEGGFPSGSLAGQPATLVRAALSGTKGPVVSRWGHILLRRALASRLDAPNGMDPVEFAALRAAVLNRLGESDVARSLVQDVDTANYSPALTDAALDAYIGTADVIGSCPMVRLQGSLRKDPQWQLLQSICGAYAGEGSSADRQLKLALSRGVAPRIDVLLAQRFAGAAGKARRTVNIEWDKVDKLTPWRFALASALGIEVPTALLSDAGPYYQRAIATAPMLPLPLRANAAVVAGKEGILSNAAMVDLYSQIYANSEITGELSTAASRLRDAYVGQTVDARLDALRTLWGSDGEVTYARQVLTAHAAARIPARSDFEDDAAPLIASMLAGGLDRSAMRWGGVVSEGSMAWALLALAQPQRRQAVSSGALDSFIGDDSSEDQRKSRFLIAGLAGLGRLDESTAFEAADRLGVKLGRETRWSKLIDQAAKVHNPALVALLAGVGMQGDGWNRMTARHLYHIVSALRQVGLDAEARMIAAEAVARA
jgi:hypothetical protein